MEDTIGSNFHKDPIDVKVSKVHFSCISDGDYLWKIT